MQDFSLSERISSPVSTQAGQRGRQRRGSVVLGAGLSPRPAPVHGNRGSPALKHRSMQEFSLSEHQSCLVPLPPTVARQRGRQRSGSDVVNGLADRAQNTENDRRRRSSVVNVAGVSWTTGLSRLSDEGTQMPCRR